MFKDEVIIHVKAGDGGRGAVSFRREKFIPRGGPDGGNGGRGGHVVMVASPHLNTLYHFVYHPKQVAPNGSPGGSSNKNGKNGHDLILKVPPGTIIRNHPHGNTLKDLQKIDESVVIAQGGRGGRGNKSYATYTNQAPRRSDPGQPGEARRLHLELKLIADVGLVGLPNAGKSTILASLSAARPKIAGYPFTTLEPYLGIVAGPDYQTLVMADLPGLIAGAHQGTGLGDKFLKHIERTKLIAHIIDFSDPLPPPEAYQIINREIKSYSKILARKPQVVIANKTDLPEAQANLRKYKRQLPRGLVDISALKRSGLQKFVKALFKKL